MQVKLLRVIQEKAVRPLGEQAEVGIDVRILSATHKNLVQLVAEGKFREDLFYRVNVIELRFPSLRERPEDVSELAEAILRRLGRRMKNNSAHAGEGRVGSSRGLRLSRKCSELENILERAITLTTAGEIRSSDIQLRGSPSERPRVGLRMPPSAVPRRPSRGDRARRHFEGAGTNKVNKTAAAKYWECRFRLALPNQEARDRPEEF